MQDNQVILTFRGDPLISTLSANLTLLGLHFSFAFLAAESRADFRLELWNWKYFLELELFSTLFTIWVLRFPQ